MGTVEKTILNIFIALIIGLVGYLCYLIPRSIERDGVASDLAFNEGCVSHGHLRDQASIYLFECSGKIELRKVK